MHLYSLGRPTCFKNILLHEDVLTFELSQLRIAALPIGRSVVDRSSSQAYSMSLPSELLAGR